VVEFYAYLQAINCYPQVGQTEFIELVKKLGLIDEA